MQSAKSLYIIANWKTAISITEAEQWILRHSADLLRWQNRCRFILCPEASSLLLIKNTAPRAIALGAQSCSCNPPGKNTGQISTKSLEELGVSYCLVNHHELGQTLQQTLGQLEELMKTTITPILCVSGAAELQYILEEAAPQIRPTGFIAFEPPKSIGATALPMPLLTDELAHIQKILARYMLNPKILYGGGVTPENSNAIIRTDIICGFLLGRTSTDFQSLEKIVSSC